MNETDSIQEIREKLVKIEALLENMKKTDELERKILEGELKLQEEKIKVANKRIGDLEDTIRWLWRTVMGSFLTGAVAILVSLIKLK